MIKKISMMLIFLSISCAAGAEEKNFTPLPGDGTTREWCDVASSADKDEETLRSRVDRYNTNERCLFYIFFLYRHKTIHLTAPLTLEKNLNDRGGGFFTGTYISGYGPGGEEDLLDITLDVTAANKDEKCGIVLKGGFSALQQIHGFSILAKSGDKMICDENGDDLYNAVSPNCDGGMKGKDCDFKGLKVFTTEPPTGPDDDDPVMPDRDEDAVADDKDACPDYFGPPTNFGCPPCPDENQDGRCDEEPKDERMEDPDEDGLTNALESKLGTDPLTADTDADGADDGADCAPLDPEQQSCTAALSPGTGGSTSGGTTGGDGTTGGSTGDGTTGGATTGGGTAAVQGCGCRMDGGSSSSNDVLPFLALTVGALLLKRRRRSHA